MAKKLEVFLYTVVLFFSMGLLLYIGYADSFKAYTKIRLDEIDSVSKIPQYKINSFLYADNQLKHFIGFNAITKPILESKKSILSMRVFDLKERLFFENYNSQEFLKSAQDFKIIEENREFSIFESKDYYKLNLSLVNKFEKIGNLEIVVDKSMILYDIHKLFETAIALLIMILFVYVIVLVLTIDRWQSSWKRNIAILYSASYLILATFTIYSLVGLYTDAIKSKSEALMNTLAQRVEKGVVLGEKLELFSGIDSLVNMYVNDNPDIAYIKLRTKNEIVFETQVKSLNTLNLSLNLLNSKEFYIDYGIDRDLIYKRLWKNIKNFLVLFIASTLIAYIFLNLAIAFKKRSDFKHNISNLDGENFHLELAKPLFFLTIFVEGLMVSFFPKYVENILINTGLDPKLTSTIFTLYFLMYAFVLIPSSKYIAKYGVKNFLISGASLFTISIFAMIFIDNFYLLFIARAFGGIGQGMVFSGIQSYILDNSSASEKTKGTSIIVYGYNAGMLSGTALGGLLVKFIYPEGVFTIYFFISLFLILYIYFFIQSAESKEQKAYVGFFEIFKNMKYVVRDSTFLKGMFCAGIPTKIVLGGVMIFAIPLLLNRAGYVNDDIGQMLIFYSLGVLGASVFSAKLADKSSNAKFVLLIGTFLSAIGLILIGSVTMFQSDVLKNSFIIFGILVLGIAHGFIHAPIVSYITDSKCTNTIGLFMTVAIYRFIERMGHALGPVVLSFILIFTNYDMVAIQFVGVAILIFGLIFAIRDR